MAATIVGPVQGVTPGLPGGSTVAYDLTAAQVIKSAPGIACTLICQVAGSITLNDCASVGAAAITNQFYTNASMTAGQVVPLNVACATAIVASAVSTGTFTLTFS